MINGRELRTIIHRFGVNTYLPMFLILFGIGLTIPVLPLYAGSLGASIGIVGLLVSCIGIGTFLADVPAGSFITRIGTRRVAVFSCLAVAASAAGVAMTERIWILGVCLVTLGVGEGSFILALQTFVRQRALPDERGRSLSLIGGVLRVAYLIGPAAGGLFARRLGLGMPFIAQGVLALSAALLLFLLKREGASSGHERFTAVSYGRIVREHWKVFLTTGFVIIVLIILRAGRDLLIPLWGKHISLDVAAIGLVMSTGAALELFLVLPAGHIMDRFGRKWAAAPCLLFLSLGLALVPLAGGFAGLLLAVLTISFGNGFGSGIVLTMSADAAPDAYPGQFLGVMRLFGDGGRIGAPLIVGLAAGTVGLAFSPLILTGFGVFGLWVLLSKVRDLKRRSFN